MSLEESIRDLTAAVEKNTAALDAIKAQAKATHGGAATAGAEKKTEAPAKGKPGRPAKKQKEPWEAEDTFLAACGDYLKSGETKEDRQRVRETVQPILNHFGASRFGEITEDQREECYGYIAQLAEAVKEGGIEAAEAVDLGLGNEDEGEDDNQSLV